jgi:hypothetical protein
VWFASVGVHVPVLGPLAAFLIAGRGDAREFAQYARVYCTSAGGQIIEQHDGSSFCVIWIKPPSQAGGFPRHPYLIHRKSAACHKRRRRSSWRNTGEKP